jgi:hypothetical protein
MAMPPRLQKMLNQSDGWFRHDQREVLNLGMVYDFSEKARPTPRAPDGWESPRFQAGFWLGAGSSKVA